MKSDHWKILLLKHTVYIRICWGFYCVSGYDLLFTPSHWPAWQPLGIPGWEPLPYLLAWLEGVDFCPQDPSSGTSLVVQWLRLWAPNAGGPGSIPGQGTRSHMPQWRLEILHAATKTCRSQIKINIKKNPSSTQEIFVMALHLSLYSEDMKNFWKFYFIFYEKVNHTCGK